MGAQVIHYPCYCCGHFASGFIVQFLAILFGLRFKIFNFSVALRLRFGDSGFGGFFPLLLSLFQELAAVLPGFFGLLGRIGFGLFDNFLRLLFGLLDFLYQFHWYPCYLRAHV